MTFWSGDKLRENLQTVIVTDPKESRIDCAAYRLRLGDEVYITPTGENENVNKTTKTHLSREGSSCVIPPGQFAFLLTEEEIYIPSNVIGFISMRSTVKFRGLVNVSGFHVDPGYKGKLVFSVFNAGPSPIHIGRGDEWFLIWFADLDRASSTDFQKNMKNGLSGIRTDMINPIAGGVQSFEGLLSKIRDNEKVISDRMAAIERDHAVAKWATALILGGLIAFGVKSYTDQRAEKADSGPVPAVSEQERGL